MNKFTTIGDKMRLSKNVVFGTAKKVVQKMPLFFERFPRVLIDETSSSVRIFGALRWGVIYLHILYSESKLFSSSTTQLPFRLSFRTTRLDKP